MNIFIHYTRKLRGRYGRRSRRSKRSNAERKKPATSTPIPFDQAEPYTFEFRSPQYEKDAMVPKHGSPPTYRESCQAVVTETFGSEKVSVAMQPSVSLTHTHLKQTSSHPEPDKSPARGRPREILYRSQLSDLRQREAKVPYPRRRTGHIPRSLSIDEETMSRLQSSLTSWRHDITTMVYFTALMIIMYSSLSWLFL